MSTIPNKRERLKMVIRSVSEDFRFANQHFNELSRRKKIAIYFLIVFVPLALIALQLLVLGVIPPDFTAKYIILNFGNPSISGMFASCYVHTVPVDHLMSNFGTYIGTMFTLVMWYFVLIPIFKRKGYLKLEYSDAAFFANAALILLVVPFAVSGISILFGRQMHWQSTLGFSGIAWAFVAYFVFLFLKMGYDKAIFNILKKKQNDPSGESIEGAIGNAIILLIIFSVMGVIIPAYAILLDIGTSRINIFGHFGGFTVGLLVTASMTLAYETHERKVQIAMIVLLAVVVITSACAWMVL